MSATRRTVLSAGVPLACTDHGGAGRDLVLMHGAGMDQGSLGALVGELTADFRIITFDFRGQGDTPAAEWTLDTAVDDLEAVIAAYSLDAPVVAGHSLGGMVAALHARRHPGSGPAINLDGHGMGTPADYPDTDPAAVSAWISGLQARSTRVIGLLRLVPRRLGPRRADARAMLAITRAVDELDLWAVYRDITGPLLIVNACAANGVRTVRLLRDPGHFSEAYRIGIRRRLAQLAETHPQIVGADIDATHMLIRTHPAETAGLIRSFVPAPVTPIRE